MLFSIHEILDLAIRLEKNGESVYRKAVDEVSKPDLIALLVWMADEEVKHARWFSDLKQKLETDSINPFIQEMGREIFGDMLGEKSFSHRDVDFSKAERTDDLISIFIEFEKDTVLFYETLKPFIEDNNTLIHLEKIIAEENDHIAMLQKFLTDKAKVTVPDD
ncbi:MAG: ferritin family protein [Desulfobacterales bacterium]